MATQIAPRIVIDPAVRHGRPVVAGTRVPVEEVLELVAQGLSFDAIVRDCFPHLTVDDIGACVRYAAQVVRDEEVDVAGIP
jgi:uncharacterized protein (DUF433 family)